MIAKLISATVLGIEGILVEVEVDVFRKIPSSFNIVGLADKTIQESKERISLALKNIGLPSYFKRQEKVTVNLAPAFFKKEGNFFDLAIALGYLLSSKQIKTSQKILSESLFIGELSLEGKVRRVNGALSIVSKALKKGIRNFVFPYSNLEEVVLVAKRFKVNLFPVRDLREAISFVEGNLPSFSPAKSKYYSLSQNDNFEYDFSHVRGQSQAKRALEIAAAGAHNILMVGPPGSGKTMLAKAFISILPSLEEKEITEITRIYSAAGLTNDQNPVIRKRPFRSPHHTASSVSLLGGGSNPKPGEITLAHRGVLFLDELPEFNRDVLEGLREPLEEGRISISRANYNITLPARFIFVGAMNPCPCGFYGDPVKECTCSISEILRYRKKVSGPLLDRIDLQINVPRILAKDYQKSLDSEPSSEVRKRVYLAKKIQKERFKKFGLNRAANSELTSKEIEKYIPLSPAVKSLLYQAVEKFNLSGRGYYKLIKTALTISDLKGKSSIGREEILEALTFKVNLLSL